MISIEELKRLSPRKTMYAVRHHDLRLGSDHYSYYENREDIPKTSDSVCEHSMYDGMRDLYWVCINGKDQWADYAEINRIYAYAHLALADSIELAKTNPINKQKIMNDLSKFDESKVQALLNEEENAEVVTTDAVENEEVAEDVAEVEEPECEQTDKVEEPKSDTPKEDAPKLKTDENGTYQCFVLTPSNHKTKLINALTEMAKTDEELAKAIAEGKKTFDGCDRFVRNSMTDLMRELKCNGCTGMCDEDIHALARWYMVNADVTDVQNAVKEIASNKGKDKSKGKSKDKSKGKDKGSTKIVPLTPQIGEIKEKEEEEQKTEDGNKVDKDGQVSLF